MNLNLALLEKQHVLNGFEKLITPSKHVLAWAIYLFLFYGYQVYCLGLNISLGKGGCILPLLCFCFYGMVYIIRSTFFQDKIGQGIGRIILFFFTVLGLEYFYIYQLLPLADIRLYREGGSFSLLFFLGYGGGVFIRIGMYSLLYVIIRDFKVIIRRLQWAIHRRSLERVKGKPVGASAWNHSLSVYHTEAMYHRVSNILQGCSEQLIEQCLKNGQELFGQIVAYMDVHLEELGKFSEPAFHMDDCFFIKEDVKGGLTRINYREIIYIEAKRKKVRLRLVQREVYVNQSFGQFRLKLPKSVFVKVGRSYVVSTAFINGVENNKIQLTDLDEEIPIGNLVESKELTSWLKKNSW